MDLTEHSRPRASAWKWWVCGLLLLASTINYMDRQTLANAAVRITTQFHLREEQYGNMELVFGWAFAIGSTFFGVAVDRMSVRWLYPIVLLYAALTRLIPALPLSNYLSNVYMRFPAAERRLVILDQINPRWAKYYSRDEAEALLHGAGFRNVRLHHRHGYSWTVCGSK